MGVPGVDTWKIRFKQCLDVIEELCETMLRIRFVALVDSWEVIVKVVNARNERLTGGSNSALMRRILQRFSRFQQWNIYHISREGNRETDRLVKLVHLDSASYSPAAANSASGWNWRRFLWLKDVV
ncbi:hypothetical protein Gogos_001381, partial [Gossypium gossypioides]|nr:hypothetical protein [Gossypium gossypioides]